MEVGWCRVDGRFLSCGFGSGFSLFYGTYRHVIWFNECMEDFLFLTSVFKMVLAEYFRAGHAGFLKRVKKL